MPSRLSPVVVFDIDDTLYLELDYIRSGIRQATRVLGTKVSATRFEDVYVGRFLGGQRQNLIQAAAEDLELSLSQEEIALFLSTYREHRPTIALSSTIKGGLDRLKARGLSLAAISDGDHHRQRLKVEALKLTEWLDPIVLTNKLGEGIDKRSPLPFQVIERHFGPDRKFIYVADNSFKDFIHPTQRGWSMLQILRQGRVHLCPTVHGLRVVETEDDLLLALDEIISRLEKT